MRPQNAQGLSGLAAGAGAATTALMVTAAWPTGVDGPAAAGAGRRRRARGCSLYSGVAATALMRAIISSVALSTGTFSLRMRFIALAHTFSLLSTVNL